MKDYYYVYNPNGSAPRYKHATKEEAIAEARRLAEEQPTRKFEILHCIGFVEAEKPKSEFTSTNVEVDEMFVNAILTAFPCPELPEGYSRWAFRGNGWKAKDVCYTYLPENDTAWSDPIPCGDPYGCDKTYYMEAIK
jgi:hypothetical protein